MIIFLPVLLWKIKNLRRGSSDSHVNFYPPTCIEAIHSAFLSLWVKKLFKVSKFSPYILKPILVRFYSNVFIEIALVQINNDLYIATSDGQFQVLILLDLAAIDNIIYFSLVNAFFAWCTGHHKCLDLPQLTGYWFSLPFGVSSSAQFLIIGDQRSYLETLLSVYTHSLGDHLQAPWLYHQLLASNFQIYIFSS